MSKNVIIVIVGGFLIAVLVALMVQASLSGSKKKQVQAVAMSEVLVASKNLSVGTELKEGDMKWQKWPKDAVFMGAIVRDGEQPASEAIEGTLLRGLNEGQPASLSIFTQEDKGEFLAASISKGMRAVSTSIQSYKIADRLIRPGDYVDILMTYRVRVNSRKSPQAAAVVNRYATETVLENVKILAIDTNSKTGADEVEEDSKSKKKRKKKKSKRAVITLELSSTGVEVLSLAETVGKISFSLRSIGDSKLAEDDNVTTDIKLSKVMTRIVQLSQGGTDTSSKVRMINNGRKTQKGMVEEVILNGTGAVDQSVDFALGDAPREYSGDSTEAEGVMEFLLRSALGNDGEE